MERPIVVVHANVLLDGTDWIRGSYDFLRQLQGRFAVYVLGLCGPGREYWIPDDVLGALPVDGLIDSLSPEVTFYVDRRAINCRPEEWTDPEYCYEVTSHLLEHRLAKESRSPSSPSKAVNRSD